MQNIKTRMTASMKAKISKIKKNIDKHSKKIRGFIGFMGVGGIIA